MTALSLYFAAAASTTKGTAEKLVSVTGGSLATGAAVTIGTTTGWCEVGFGSTLTSSGLGSIGSPSGNGALYDTSLSGNTMASGTWTAAIPFLLSQSGKTLSGSMVLRFYKYNSTGGTYTSIGSITQSVTITSTQSSVSFSGSQSSANFNSGDFAYCDLWLNVTSTTMTSGGQLNYGFSSSATQGVATSEVVTPGYSTTSGQVVTMTETTPVIDTFTMQTAISWTETASTSDTMALQTTMTFVETTPNTSQLSITSGLVPSVVTAGTPGGVRLLIQDVYYPFIRQETINIDRTANDPIPTFKVTLQDDPSQISISELQEVIFLDVGQITNPTHNLLKNPVINPYATGWTLTTVTGGSITQLSPGVTFSATNIASSIQLAQTTQNGLVVAGQWYMLSGFVQTTTLTNLDAYLLVAFLDPTGATIQSTPLLIPTISTNTRFSLPMQAPNNAVSAYIGFGLTPLTGTNSGTGTFTSMQFEPMSFTTGVAQIPYPTPFCANGQANCLQMPDGTTIRQYRLFGGLVTKATAGKYIGKNRQWTVTVSGYAWLFQKQLLNDTYTTKTDAFIFAALITKYFANQFSTAQIAIGATLDTFGYAYNGTMRDAADALAANSNFYYYVDAYRAIIYQPPGYNQIGFLLSDYPDNVTSFPYYNYSVDVDGTQLGNACLVTGATNISAIEYDAQSIAYYNLKTNGSGMFWRTVNDSTIPTTAAARQRAIGEISQYNYARQVVHMTTNQLMIPGYTVLFSSATDNLFDSPMLIQKSTLVLQGFKSLQQPYYECTCDLGGFNPDLVNITIKLLRKQLTNSNSVGTPVLGLMVTDSTTFIDNITARIVTGSSSTYGMGTYGSSVYAFSVPSVPTTTYGTGTYGDPTHGYA